MMVMDESDHLTPEKLNQLVEEVKNIPDPMEGKHMSPTNPLTYIQSQRLSRRYTRILAEIARYHGTHDPRKWNINKFYKYMRRKKIHWSEEINEL